MANSIDTATLRSILDYNPDTGVFVWNIRASPPAKVGSDAGKPLLTGHVSNKYMGVPYLAHRLAVQYMTGQPPAEWVDHIDRDPSNNRYANLRQASRSQNAVNMHPDPMRGITWIPRHQKWRARVWSMRRSITLGHFASLDEAKAARANAAAKLYGEFVPV